MASCDLGMMVTSCRGMSFGGDSQGWAREVACVLSLSPTQVVPAEWRMGRESERCNWERVFRTRSARTQSVWIVGV
jgi:hypothetical protein